MASFGSGLTQGLFVGSRVGQQWRQGYENQQSEEIKGKLFQLANEEQAIKAGDQEVGSIMEMVGKSSMGDIQKTLADAYVESGGKMDSKVYNAINLFSQGLYDVKEKAVGYNERRTKHEQNKKMFGKQMENYDSQIMDRAERRKLTAQKNANDSKLFALTVQEKQASIADKQKKIKQAQTEEGMSMQESYDTSMDGIQLIDDMINHKGRASATGWQSSFPTVAGSDAADFEAMVDTLKSKNFMNQIQNMRGMGALSDAEGKKVSDAITSLNLNQSDESFEKALNTIRSIYQRGADNMRKKAKQRGFNIKERGAEGNAQNGNGKTIVRTGTSNGRKVVQYSDGSVEYAD